jgi:hypothetical protein
MEDYEKLLSQMKGFNRFWYWKFLISSLYYFNATDPCGMHKFNRMND